MLKLGQSFQSFYGELDSNQHATKYITTTNRISEAAKTFTLSMHELCADVHVLSKTMTQIRKSITERDDALVEYTRADNNLKAILKKEEPTHPKANKAQLKHQECKVRYENLNSELKSKFADYDSNRAIHIQSYFAKLVKIQARFFSIAAKACEDLESQTSDSPSSSLRSSSPTTSASPSPRPQHPSLPSPRSQTIASPSPSPSPFAVAPASLSSSQHPSDPISNDAFPTAPNVNPYYSGGGMASRKERRKSWDSPRSSRRFEPEQLDSSQPDESYSPSPSPPSYKSTAPLVPPLPQLPQQPPQQQQQHSFSPSSSSSQRMPSPRREAPLPQPPSPHRPPQPQPQPHPYRNSTTVAAAAMPAYPPPPRREPPPRPPRRNTTLGHM
ncbi:hypothetical protein QOT17_007203 [Balamuthia mandrillaris]